MFTETIAGIHMDARYKYSDMLTSKYLPKLLDLICPGHLPDYFAHTPTLTSDVNCCSHIRTIPEIRSILISNFFYTAIDPQSVQNLSSLIHPKSSMLSISPHSGSFSSVLN